MMEANVHTFSLTGQVALKPGHSLMDWIRFAKSGRDHTGLRGRLIEVTEEELKKHGGRDDCWTCIRGHYSPDAYSEKEGKNVV